MQRLMLGADLVWRGEVQAIGAINSVASRLKGGLRSIPAAVVAVSASW